VWAELRKNTPYDAWLQQAVADLSRPYPKSGTPNFGWGARARLPIWATSSAEESVRAVVSRRESRAGALSASRVTHLTVSGIRTGGQRLGPLRRLMERHGVTLTLPYMDDSVIEAALSVDRTHQRPGVVYKPLLREAMRGVSTGRVLDRSTKGEFSKEVYDGIARNRDVLLRLFDSSRLADRGLVDVDVLRGVLLDDMRFDHQTTALEQTIAVETWLRGVEAGLTASDEPATRDGGAIVLAPQRKGSADAL
jgi:asparagine synthase (glutamine-hydrolysing)